MGFEDYQILITFNCDTYEELRSFLVRQPHVETLTEEPQHLLVARTEDHIIEFELNACELGGRLSLRVFVGQPEGAIDQLVSWATAAVRITRGSARLCDSCDYGDRWYSSAQQISFAEEAKTSFLQKRSHWDAEYGSTRETITCSEAVQRFIEAQACRGPS
jgi:hypothetical protein